MPTAYSLWDGCGNGIESSYIFNQTFVVLFYWIRNHGLGVSKNYLDIAIDTLFIWLISNYSCFLTKILLHWWINTAACNSIQLLRLIPSCYWFNFLICIPVTEGKVGSDYLMGLVRGRGLSIRPTYLVGNEGLVKIREKQGSIFHASDR